MRCSLHGTDIKTAVDRNVALGDNSIRLQIIHTCNIRVLLNVVVVPKITLNLISGPCLDLDGWVQSCIWTWYWYNYQGHTCSQMLSIQKIVLLQPKRFHYSIYHRWYWQSCSNIGPTGLIQYKSVHQYRQSSNNWSHPRQLVSSNHPKQSEVRRI